MYGGLALAQRATFQGPLVLDETATCLRDQLWTESSSNGAPKKERTPASSLSPDDSPRPISRGGRNDLEVVPNDGQARVRQCFKIGKCDSCAGGICGGRRAPRPLQAQRRRNGRKWNTPLQLRGLVWLRSWGKTVLSKGRGAQTWQFAFARRNAHL